MTIKKVMQRIGNTRVYDAAIWLFFAFMMYALIDVSWKIIEHNRYDMQGLIEDIQEYYPDSRLTFQNIKIVDTDFKVSQGRGASTTYQEAKSLFIRNGSLHREPNFLYILFLTPLVIIFVVFNTGNPDIKLKEIFKMNSFTKLTLLAALGIMILSQLIHPDDKYYFKSYKNTKTFTIQVEGIKKEIDINDYKK